MFDGTYVQLASTVGDKYHLLDTDPCFSFLQTIHPSIT